MKGDILKLLVVLSGCAASVLATVPAKANFLDGNDLYEHCQTRSASALNYILGSMTPSKRSQGLESRRSSSAPGAGSAPDTLSVSSANTSRKTLPSATFREPASS